jgi:hypothetical protein
VPLALLVDVPLATVVPPWGPVTVPPAVAPFAVLVTRPDALTVVPVALVAVPLPVMVLPFWVTVAVAVPPPFPVTVFCAMPMVHATQRVIAKTPTHTQIFMRLLSELKMNAGSLMRTRNFDRSFHTKVMLSGFTFEIHKIRELEKMWQPTAPTQHLKK